MSSHVHLLLLLILVTLLGYVSIARLPKDWEHDDQRIVVDEIAGLLTTLLWIPINLTNVILAFTLFRIYDIFKPFGIRKFDDSKTSWSVLVDDLVAGVYANVTLRLLLIFLAWI